MFKRLVVLCALCALLPISAYAAGAAVTSYGPRVGFSTSPDQLVVGGQLSVGNVTPEITFDPNVELGFGDNATLIAFNLDLHYHFDISGSNWSPYVGAGVGINFISIDLPPGVSADNSFTKVGGQLIGGASVPTASGNKFFGELKLGLGDSAIPDMKLLVGWNFKR
jgi:hypothetical protein